MRKNTKPVLRKYVVFPVKIYKKDTWTINKMLLLLDSVRLLPCPPLVLTVNSYM